MRTNNLVKAIVAFAFFVFAGWAPALAAPRSLEIFPNGHVRFENGPELNKRQLRAELQRMSREHDCPDVRLRPDKQVQYGVVAAVLKEFQQFGCNDLGFVGNYRPE